MTRAWQDYEAYITARFKSYYPSSAIIPNYGVEGKFSKVRRQIDIAIQTRIEDIEIFGIVECKYYNKKIDVKTVESIIGFMEDVGADFGYIITNKGFSEAAQRRTEIQHLLLRVVAFSQLDQARLTTDDLINHKIQTLDCVPAVFLLRQQQRSDFVNIQMTSYETRTVAFKDGFARTDYFAKKKLLEETARVFRDFPCIERIKICIPLAVEQKLYSSDVELMEFEQFLQVDFSHLHNDIALWRGFLTIINKPVVERWAAQYVRISK